MERSDKKDLSKIRAQKRRMAEKSAARIRRESLKEIRAYKF